MTLPTKTDPFPSFDAMRAAHSKLLKQYSLDAVADKTNFIDTALDFLTRGQATGALLDLESDRDGAQTMLDYWSSRLYRVEQTVTEVTLNEFDESLAPEIPDELCPYRGLSAFSETDSGIFFGRQKILDEMVTRLGDSRLLAVIGPSGSGKSSVVRAGLLPMLKDGAVPGADEWTYLPIFVPGSVPLKNLLVAITRAEAGESMEDAEENDEEHDHSTETAEIVSNPGYLQNLLEEHFGKNVVIVVDQFEEIFTLCDNETTRKVFVENLLAISNASDANHHVIITMRVDFETKLAVYPELQEAVEDNTVRLTPLTAADLREAIEEPARQIGLKFEEGLIDNLLNDILGEPAALPLLQFTLLKLWENRDRNRITWEDYRKLGGGRQALANSADELYNSMIPEDQVTARRLLLRLVRPGEGMEVTSQRMRRVDLYSRSDAVDRIDRVLEKFIDARLLRLTHGRTDFDDQIEVAHEALVRNWPTLVGWLEDEREAIRQRRRLTTAAERWYQMGCSEDLLLRGVELEEALRYDDLNESESNFIRASQQARADEIEKAQQVADELRRRNRIITIASIVAIVVAVFAVGLGLVAVDRQRAAATALETATQALGDVQIANREVLAQATISEAERQRADEQRRAAETAEESALQERNALQTANMQIIAQQATEKALSTEKAVQETAAAQAQSTAEANSVNALISQLADQARSLVSRQTDLGILLGIEAANIGENLSDKGVLMDVMQANPRLDRYLYGHQGAVNTVDYRPDGRQLASAGADLDVYLWSLNIDEDPTILQSGGEISVNALDYSPSSTILAAGTCAGLDRGGTCSGGLLQLWELTTGNHGVTTLEIHRDAITAVQFDPSGALLATGAEDGIIQIWNVPESIGTGLSLSPNALFTFTGQNGAIRSMIFTPNRRYLISASEDGTVYVRDLPAASVVVSFIDHKAPVRAAAVSKDGRYLATAGDDNNIFIYDLNRFVRVGSALSKHTSPVTGLDFNPDGTALVSSSEDGTIIVWDLSELSNSGRFAEIISTQTLLGHTDAVFTVQYSPDGAKLVSGGRSSAVIEWFVNVSNPLVTHFVQSDDAVTGLGFSFQGDQLIVARDDRSLTSWDVATGLASKGSQWTQVDSTLRVPSAVESLFFETSEGESGSEDLVLGMLQNKVTSEDVLGVDASRLSGSVDWDEVRDDGYAFAFIKATQGERSIDAAFQENWDGVKETGLLRGAYHFFVPTEDPVAQADFFTTIVGFESGDLPPVVDVETDGGLSGPEVLANLQAFLTRLEEIVQVKPIIYTNASFWMRLSTPNQGVEQGVVPVTGGVQVQPFNASDYPLWVANYTSGDQPLLPTGWSTWTFWQYTDDGEVEGFDGTVFLSRFNGSLQALESLAKGEPEIAIDPGSESTSLIDIESREQVGALLPLFNPSSTALHLESSLLAVGSKNGSITFWNIELGYQTEVVLSSGNASVDSLAFSKNGQYIAAGNAEGRIVVWDLENREGSPVTLSGHTSSVTSLAFGEEWMLLASGSANGNVLLWDLSQVDSIGQPLQGPNSSVAALAIDREESLLAAGYANGEVLIWEIDPQSWLQKACDRVGRNLTQSEWGRYLPGVEYRETCP